MSFIRQIPSLKRSLWGMVCCALCGPAFWGLACFAGLRSGRFLSAHGRFALLAICNRLFLRFKKPLSISTPICALYPKRHSLPFSSDAHSDLTARPGSLRKTGRQGSWNLQWYSSSEEVLCKQLFLKSAAQVCGEAQAAPDAAIEYTKERVQFGRRISQFQNTQFQLADMYAKTEAAKWPVYSAAMKKQNHEPYLGGGVGKRKTAPWTVRQWRELPTMTIWPRWRRRWQVSLALGGSLAVDRPIYTP